MSSAYSKDELACIARGVAKIAAALSGHAPLDPNDRDIAWCRSFGAAQAAGQFDPDYLPAVIAIRKEGCQCKVKLTRVEGGGYHDEHEPHCQVLRNRELARAGMAPPQGPPRDARNPLGQRTPLAETSHGRMLDRLTGGGRR
jgi:hypothetical protein